MYIKGYAYTDEWENTAKERSDRFKELKHHVGTLNMTRTPAYNHGNFCGKLVTDEEKKLSELDLAIIADRGNLCFGGNCTIDSDGTFRGEYYTD